MVCPITQGDHNKSSTVAGSVYAQTRLSANYNISDCAILGFPVFPNVQNTSQMMWGKQSILLPTLSVTLLPKF